MVVSSTFHPPGSSSNSGSIKVLPVKLPSVYFKKIDARFRQMAADLGTAEIKKKMNSGIFKHPTGAAANSMRSKVEGNSIVWWSTLPHVGAQEKGVKPHAMWYLLNKTIPIRSRGFGGEQVTFARATLKSFMMGKWFHKGYPGKYFMKHGIDETVRQLPQLLQKATDSVGKQL